MMIGCSPLELHQDLEPETTALRISPMVFRRSCSGEIARFFSARPGERMGGCVAAERGPKSTRQPAAYACVLTVYPKNDPCEPAVICFSRNQMGGTWLSMVEQVEHGAYIHAYYTIQSHGWAGPAQAVFCQHVMRQHRKHNETLKHH